MSDEKTSATLTLEMLQKTINDLAKRQPLKCHHPIMKKIEGVQLCPICGYVTSDVVHQKV